VKTFKEKVEGRAPRSSERQLPREPAWRLSASDRRNGPIREVELTSVSKALNFAIGCFKPCICPGNCHENGA
jgi:hypothetical protein